MRKLTACLLMLAASLNSNATYNANMSGVVAWVATYADGDSIYFALMNQPGSHPGCSPYYFVITAAVPADRRKAMLANLLIARTTGEAINIGYDNAGDCAEGYIRVHRVG
jgi:hypothetical protein